MKTAFTSCQSSAVIINQLYIIKHIVYIRVSTTKNTFQYITWNVKASNTYDTTLLAQHHLYSMCGSHVTITRIYSYNCSVIQLWAIHTEIYKPPYFVKLKILINEIFGIGIEIVSTVESLTSNYRAYHHRHPTAC